MSSKHGIKPTAFWLAWLGAGVVPLLTSLVLLYFGELVWAGLFLAIVFITAFAFFTATKKMRSQNATLDRTFTTVDTFGTLLLYRLYFLAVTVWATIELLERQRHVWAAIVLLVGLGLSILFHIRNMRSLARHLDEMRKSDAVANPTLGSE